MNARSRSSLSFWQTLRRVVVSLLVGLLAVPAFAVDPIPGEPLQIDYHPTGFRLEGAQSAAGASYQLTISGATSLANGLSLPLAFRIISLPAGYTYTAGSNLDPLTWITASGNAVFNNLGAASVTITIVVPTLPVGMPAGEFAWGIQPQAWPQDFRNLINAQINDAGGTVNALAAATLPPTPNPTVTDPIGGTRLVGQSFTFSVAATGTPAPTLQWKKLVNGVAQNVPNGTGSSLTLTNLALADAGDYFVTASNVKGDVSSAPATLVVQEGPAFTSASSATFTVGQPNSFTVTTTGTPTPGVTHIAGALPNGVTATPSTGGTLILSGTPTAPSVTDYVLTFNAANTVGSATQLFTLKVPGTPPTITAQPDSVTVAAGSSVNFSVTATGSATLAYQWYKGATLLAGQTAPMLSLSNVSAADVASYSVTVSNPWGQVTSNAATLALQVVTPPPAECGPAIVRHAPAINGNAGVDGSLQQLLGEDVALNGNAFISENFLVPGLPVLRANGNPVYGTTVVGAGAATPVGYQVTLNGNAVLGHLVTRTDAVTIPSVSAPTTYAGNRDVRINGASDTLGNSATIRDLSLSGNAGTVALPTGAYRDISVSGNGNVLVLGNADGSLATYTARDVKFSGNTTLKVIGPVLIKLSGSAKFSGLAGTSGHSELLNLQLASGDLALDGQAEFYGSVLAPAGEVTINGQSKLCGGLSADRLRLDGWGLLDVCGCRTH